MRMIAAVVFAMMLAMAGTAVAENAGVAAPIPMLDTGGHMAKINTVAFTPNGTQIVSASEDKTIRVWDLAAGKTARVIRGEAGRGHAGKVYAMALSPDGKWLAAGVLEVDAPNGSVTRLYDLASGKLVARLKGDGIVTGLAFSPDNRLLISGNGDGTGTIWDVVTASALHRLKGHRGEVYAVGFSADGAHAVTGSLDHELRLWSVESGAQIAKMSGHGDKVVSLATSSDGRIASADISGEIRLWDGRTGAFLKTLAKQSDIGGGLSFSPDGKLLLTGMGGGEGNSCHVYDTASGREIAAYRGHDNLVLATAISPDGRWAATGGGNNFEIHIWDLRTGEQRKGANGQPLTLGGKGRSVWAVGFSADSQRIAWGNLSKPTSANDRGPLQFAMPLPSGDAQIAEPVHIGETGASRPAPDERAFVRAASEHGVWSLSYRKGGDYGRYALLDIAEGEDVMATIERGPDSGYTHRAYSFTPDGKTVISAGNNGVLAAYDRAGRKLCDFYGHENDVWTVAPSPDGRYLVSGASDMTSRLWNLKTCELLVSLYRGNDGEWVMWTPQGYYAASGPGAELIGWQFNRGSENEADYVRAAQLRAKFNRPDIVAKAVQLASAEEAIRQSTSANFKLSDLQEKQVPRFGIVAPAADAAASDGGTEIVLNVAPSAEPVKIIRIQVNGIQVAEHVPETGPGFQPGTHKFRVPLVHGKNTIRVVAVNEIGETSAEIAVTHGQEGALDKRGTLYILAIGVDKYPRLGMACTEADGKTPKSCDLRVAGADAKAFAETMAARLGPLHSKVFSTVLVNGGNNGEPLASNILDALGELSNTQPNDTVLLFISGHGIVEGPNYTFVASDAEFSGRRLRNSTVVPWANIQLAIESAKGRRILFLDTCHSGNSYNQRLSNDAYQSNIIVYSAARWDQEALESTDLGHGLFTYAVIEGFKGAAKDAAGEIHTRGLHDYLRTRVSELAAQLKRGQEPQYFRGRDAEDYVLARVQPMP